MSQTSTTGKAQESIPRDVLVQNPREVRAYLKKHARLAKLVSPICLRARGEFGPEAELSLLVSKDPEIDDRYLKLLIRLPSYDSSVMGRIDSIWDQFESDLWNIPGWLLVTSDYRRLP